MGSTDHEWRAPALTANGSVAVSAYRRGIASLIAGAPDAERSLAAAVAADPAFALAHIGLAAARFVHGRPFVAPVLADAPMTGAERHHAEIVQALCLGDRDHAADLRREHLLEYPADLLVVWGPLLPEGTAR